MIVRFLPVILAFRQVPIFLFLSVSVPAICLGQTKRNTTTTPLVSTNCENVESTKTSSGYIISLAECNGQYWVWSSRDRTITSPSNADGAIDQVLIGVMASGETVSIAPYCTAKGKHIEWLAMYGRTGTQGRGGSTNKIRKAWGISAKNGRIFRYSSKFISSVKCVADHP